MYYSWYNSLKKLDVKKYTEKNGYSGLISRYSIMGRTSYIFSCNI